MLPTNNSSQIYIWQRLSNSLDKHHITTIITNGNNNNNPALQVVHCDNELISKIHMFLRFVLDIQVEESKWKWSGMVWCNKQCRAVPTECKNDNAFKMHLKPHNASSNTIWRSSAVLTIFNCSTTHASKGIHGSVTSTSWSSISVLSTNPNTPGCFKVRNFCIARWATINLSVWDLENRKMLTSSFSTSNYTQ